MPTQQHDSWLSGLGVDVDKVRNWVNKEADEVKDDVNKAENWAKDEVQKGADWVKTEADNAVDDLKKGADWVKTEANKAVGTVKKGTDALKMKALGDQSGKPVPRPMEGDCNPVHGQVPGPKNHLFCSTHGHVVDTDQKVIIANSIAAYVKDGVAKAVQSVNVTAAVGMAGGAMAAAEGGDFDIGGEYSQPVDEFDAWGGKIKVKVAASVKYSAKVTGVGAGNLAIGKEGLSTKVAATLWQSHGKVELGSVDLFKDFDANLETQLSTGGVGTKIEFSTDTPIGKASMAVVVIEMKPHESPKLGAVEGAIDGIPKTYDPIPVEGHTITDIKVERFGAKITVEPDWVKIIAKEVGERAVKEGAEDAGKSLAERAGQFVLTGISLDAVITAGMVAGGIAAIAGTMQALINADELESLSNAVAKSWRDADDGWRRGAAGEGAPSEPFARKGYEAGAKVFDAAYPKFKQALLDQYPDANLEQDHPDAMDAAIRVAIANDLSKYDGLPFGQGTALHKEISDAYWYRYLDSHKDDLLGLTSKTASLAYNDCYSYDPSESDPGWKEYIRQHPRSSKL
jgi:hypothetical protein